MTADFIYYTCDTNARTAATFFFRNVRMIDDDDDDEF